jgi:hypothetical protein
MRKVFKKIFILGITSCFVAYLALNYFGKVKRNVISNDHQFKEEHTNFKSNMILKSIKHKNASTELKSSTKRFLAFDGGGFEQSISNIIKCSNNIEIELTTSYENADFSFFHMSLIQLDKIDAKANKKIYTMVYTLESEVY